jgi:hypothetical protein
MPPELQELYNLYQQELQTRQSEKEANFISELNTMLRVLFSTTNINMALYVNTYGSFAMVDSRQFFFKGTVSRDSE